MDTRRYSVECIAYFEVVAVSFCSLYVRWGIVGRFVHHFCVETTFRIIVSIMIHYDSVVVTAICVNAKLVMRMRRRRSLTFNNISRAYRSGA